MILKKKIKNLSSLYLLPIALIFLIFAASSGTRGSESDKIYYSSMDDIELSKTRPIISNVNPEIILTEGKAVITLGFKLPHAYLAFEFMSPNGEIGIQGIHYAGADSHCGYLCVKKPDVRVDRMREDILPRFIESEETILEPGLDSVRVSRKVGPLYEKFRSFIVDREQVDALLKKVPSIRKKISFSVIGDVFLKNSHNCCSFAAMILKESGVNVKIPGLWLRSPENLKYYIAEYEKTEEGKSIVRKPGLVERTKMLSIAATDFLNTAQEFSSMEIEEMNICCA